MHLNRLSALLSFRLLVGTGLLLGGALGYGLGMLILDSVPARAAGRQPMNFRSFETYHFSGSRNCSRCHDGLRDEEGTEISLVRDWTQSLMAYAFVDPLWKAKVKSETLRNPQLGELIEEKCVRCHSPMASVEATFLGLPVALFGPDGFAQSSNPLYPAAMEGVSCTLCHQILDTPDLGTDAGNSGKFKITDIYPDSWRRPIFGQFDQLAVDQMVAAVRYLPKFDDHIHESKVCATCHDLKTPFVDASGQLVRDEEGNLVLFPEQMPFVEWLNSAYGADEQSPNYQRCHECHLTHAEPTPLSRVPRQLPQREDFSKHTFFTENIVLLKILEENASFLGIGSVDFSDAIAEGEAYLANAGMVDVVSVEHEGNLLKVDVLVENLAGHKLPTSIPTRRAFVHFTVMNQVNGSVLFESGRPLSDGRIQGADSDAVTGAGAFESHHDEISDPNDVQIYEGIMGNTENEVTYTLLRAAKFLKDNRLLPVGFDNENPPEEVAPVGGCLGDGDFTGGSDKITYIVNIGDTSVADLEIHVELLDQTLSYRFIQDLLSDGDPIIGRFGTMYEPHQGRFELIDSVTYELE